MGLTIAPLSSTRGLQSLSLDDDRHWRWHDLEPNAGFAVVFAGEGLARMANNTIRPLLHRVVHQSSERISSPYFQRPPADHPIGTRSNGKPLRWRDFFQTLKK